MQHIQSSFTSFFNQGISLHVKCRFLLPEFLFQANWASRQIHHDGDCVTLPRPTLDFLT